LTEATADFSVSMLGAEPLAYTATRLATVTE
jgi:hypothetical protein